MPRKKDAPVTPVETVKHKDKRVNIPTEELRDFVAEYEAKPKTVLYPRDPSLDPQLVWKGKDEQDSQELVVPAVPVYIQEKIQPKAIIENVRAEAQKEIQAPQISLFADFNGIEFEDLVDFYQHEQNWSNRMILGDSLLVMTSLAEKEGLKGKVQMIYIDPPYGIKFGSNWQVSTRKRDVKDGRAEDLTRQPEQIRAFRDTWKLGIHSYLAYLRDRLVVAREMLTETGSVFVQIGDENVHLVRCLMDEILGSENFVSLITFATTSGFESKELARGGDYIIWYAKNTTAGIKIRLLFEEVRKDPGEGSYRWILFPDGNSRGLSAPQPSPARGEGGKVAKKVSPAKGDGDKGISKRVAVCIGPEHGTVGPQLVKEAAKEAVQGIGFDLLVVCGFAFDPHVSEEAKRYGKLAVLMARMNPDLAMGDELLKKTGAGNLFMIFGEPDVVIHRVGESQPAKPKKGQPRGVAPTNTKLFVEIKGVDVYDPTTGQIRSSSTDDIACWFIDTEYNGESFFVRHAYFTGADEPYEKLKRALRADVDESAWASLYSTKSRPFPVPKTGKIAIKVINHYGDEVLKVYDII